jgi:hypothetical protein
VRQRLCSASGGGSSAGSSDGNGNGGGVPVHRGVTFKEKASVEDRLNGLSLLRRSPSHEYVPRPFFDADSPVQTFPLPAASRLLDDEDEERPADVAWTRRRTQDDRDLDDDDREQEEWLRRFESASSRLTEKTSKLTAADKTDKNKDEPRKNGKQQKGGGKSAAWHCEAET